MNIVESKNSFMLAVENVMSKVIEKLDTLKDGERMSAKELAEEVTNGSNLSSQMVSLIVTAVVNGSSTYQSKVGRNGGIVRVTDTLMDSESVDTESQKSVAV